MRLVIALVRAMRTRQADRLGLDEADRLAAGGRAGPGLPGLDHLLDAVRASATTRESSGEQATVAALAAERRRAVAATRPEGKSRVQVPTSARTIVVSIVTGLVLLSAGGTAVAARTGNLPAGVQQHAHRLFSVLGVPAPGTGGSAPGPAPSPTPAPVGSASLVAPTPAPTAVTPTGEQVGWCEAWQAAAAGGRPINGRSRRDLIAAAGGADNVGQFCAGVTASASAGATTQGSTAPATHHATPSHPTPHAVTPSHPGRKK